MTTRKNKSLILILDGLGDRPNSALANKTPLQFANTPNLKKIAEKSQCGIMDPISCSIPVDTHTGVGILFGIPSHEAPYLYRGAVEAAGIGLEILPEDIFLRSNLSTFDPSSDTEEIIDRRAGRIDEEGKILCQALRDIHLDDGIIADVYSATQHRCVIRLRGENLSARVTNTDPGEQRKKYGVLLSKSLDDNENSKRTANAINQFTKITASILSKHPINLERKHQNKAMANILITRGAGLHHKPQNILNHLNLKTAVVAAEGTILGLAEMFGFKKITHDSFNALPTTNVETKFELAELALQDHDVVFLHIKGTDITAHDRQPKAKAQFIEKIDACLKDILTLNVTFAVCADHSTNSNSGDHTGDPVPILIYSPNSRFDDVEDFDEITCSRGSLGRINGQGFLLSVLDNMDVLKALRREDINIFLNHPTEYPLNKE